MGNSSGVESPPFMNETVMAISNTMIGSVCLVLS